MPKKINQDGKEYTFNPGPNGSLTAPMPPQPAPYQGQSKVVPMSTPMDQNTRGQIAMNIANTMMKGKLGYK